MTAESIGNDAIYDRHWCVPTAGKEENDIADEATIQLVELRFTLLQRHVVDRNRIFG